MKGKQNDDSRFTFMGQVRRGARMGHLVSGRFWIYHISCIFESIGAKSLPRLADSLAWAFWASDRVLGFTIRPLGSSTRYSKLAGFG